MLGTRLTPHGRTAGTLAALMLVAIAAYVVVEASCAPRDPFRLSPLSKAKQLSTALIEYAFENDDRFPPASRWADATVKHVVNAEAFALQSPDRESPTYLFGFASALGGQSVATIKQPTKVVLVYESKQNRWNQSGNKEDLGPLRPTRGEPRHVFGFVDGHVAAWTLERLRSGELIWP